MKFRCERDTLADAVATAQRTVASRSGALPVLQDLRITATGDGLELVGSDLEITNRVQVPAEVEETGVAVVPKLLGDIVRKLEPGPVTVAVTGDEAVITAGRFSTSLRLKPAEDYPRLASNDGQGVRLDAAAFALALRQVVRAASKDDLRPILTGVLLTTHARWSAPRRDRLVPARRARPQGREHARRGPAGARRGQGSGRSATARRRR